MLGKLLCIALLSVTIYHLHDWYMQGQLEQRVESYRQEKNNEQLQKHTEEFSKPEIIRVADGVHMALGYALANSIMIEAPEGLIIIDTTESMESAHKIFTDFRKITQKPVKAIIFTHNHADHVNGAQAFLSDSKDPKSVEVWAHHTLMQMHEFSSEMVGPATFTRGMRQFGALLPQDHENSGIGIRLDFTHDRTVGILEPNKLLYQEEMDAKIAGLKLRLIHIPGETDDQIAIYWPEKGILFCADDFYRAFPNLYAIRGTPFRSLEKWTKSVDKMRALRPKILVPSHTRAVIGEENVFGLLTDYRDAIQYVHDQTVRYMNLDMHPEEIASKVRLPETLANNPYLQPFYGTVRWSVKGLYSGYQGWFNGDVVDLNPYTPAESSIRLVKLGGGVDTVLSAAQTSLNDDDPQWALQLSSAVLHVEPKNPKAIELRVKSLFDLARTQISANGNNYYLTVAYETLGKIEIGGPPESMRLQTIHRVSIRRLFELMSLRLKAEECEHLDTVAEFYFPDIEQKIAFHVRNGIMDLLAQGKLQPVRAPDLNVTVSAKVWRQLAAGERNALLAAGSSEIVAKPSLRQLKTLMDCFDPK